MLLSGALKSSFQRENLPIAGLQHGCLSVGRVRRWLTVFLNREAEAFWALLKNCPWFEMYSGVHSCISNCWRHHCLVQGYFLLTSKFCFSRQLWANPACSASLSFSNATHHSPSDEMYFYNINHTANLIFSTDESPRMNNTKWKHLCCGFILVNLSWLLCNRATFFCQQRRDVASKLRRKPQV